MSDEAVHLASIQYPWGRGWQWIREGAQMFAAAPGMWIALVLLQLLIGFAASMLPDVPGAVGVSIGLLVSAVSTVVGIFIEAGLLLACDGQRRGQPPQVATLFAAFGHATARNLFGLALIQVVAWGMIAAVAAGSMAIVLGVSVALTLVGAIELFQAILGSLEALAVICLLLLPLSLLLVMASWMALPLVLLRGVAPVQAMVASFKINFRNVRALTVYGLGMAALVLVAILPLLLGMLVWLPVATTSRYAAFCDLVPRPPH